MPSPELQETVEITTPVSGKKVILRGYATGRVRQEVQRVYLKGTKMDASMSDAQSGKVTDGPVSFDPSVDIDATYKALELMVLSVDGTTDNVLDRILDMHEDDFVFVKGEVDKLTNPLQEQS